MFRRILCPIDFDPNSSNALDVACKLARQNDGTLYVLQVVPVPAVAVGQPLAIEPIEGAQRETRIRLERVIGERLRPGTDQILVVNGDPAGEILRVADEIKPDLIVMATHGRTGLSHFFLGSVAERVVREATCPVLTIRIAPE